MKKFLCCLAGLVMILGFGVMAGAETFTLNSYDVVLRTVDPGLVLYETDILTQPTTWNLNVGDSTTWFNFFRVGTTESTVNWGEDTVQYPITVSFNWTAPSVTVPDTVNGQTSGWTLLFVDGGIVDWSDSPAVFNFGTGGQFKVALSDGHFGVPGSDVIQAKLTYVSASVPEPTTLLFLGFGLIGLAVTRIRKKH